MCARESQERRGRAERDAEGPVLVAPREALDVGPHGGRVVVAAQRRGDLPGERRSDERAEPSRVDGDDARVAGRGDDGAREDDVGDDARRDLDADADGRRAYQE